MKLATIEKIDELLPHPNADRLEIVKVLGYQCVVPKDLHKEGDLVVYIQPDTVLPKDREWAEEYVKYSPSRVKAVKLRGEWSEGIVAPLSKWGNKNWFNLEDIGMEISDEIGVVKYEPPLPKNESAVGGLPYQISKTDEERFENLGDKIPFGSVCDVTLKIDGQSATYGYKVDEDRFFVTGRRFEVASEEENRYSIHVEKVKEKIVAYCKKYNLSLAFRGESYGNGVQGHGKNPHANKPHSLAIFSVWNIDERRYENYGSEHYFVNACEEMGLETVPLLQEDVEITPELLEHYSTGIKKLPNGDRFEGVVIQHEKGSFKVINKDYDANK
jgi:RNA ligase (TIGR02306 family)